MGGVGRESAFLKGVSLVACRRASKILPELAGLGSQVKPTEDAR